MLRHREQRLGGLKLAPRLERDGDVEELERVLGERVERRGDALGGGDERRQRVECSGVDGALDARKGRRERQRRRLLR